MSYDMTFDDNNMPAGVCPECGADDIEYYDTDVEGATSGYVSLLWECQNCGIMGRDDFDLVLDTRSVAADGEEFGLDDLDVTKVIWARS